MWLLKNIFKEKNTCYIYAWTATSIIPWAFPYSFREEFLPWVDGTVLYKQWFCITRFLSQFTVEKLETLLHFIL